MFKKKDPLGDALRGAIKPSSASVAKTPRVEFLKGSTETRVDLRRFCSPVIDQRPLGSCAACSTVAALELLAARDRRPEKRLSILFLYYNGRNMIGMADKDSGLMSQLAPAAVLAFGACDDKLWPYSIDKLTREPPTECYVDARTTDAVQFARIGSSAEVKVSLSQGVPVIFGSDIPRAYYQAAGSDSLGRMPEWGLTDPGPDTGHAMLIVGYDDVEKWWLVKNSIGTAFGERGYVRVPYSVFDARVWDEDMWAIGKLEDESKRKLVGGGMREAVEDMKKFAAVDVAAHYEAMRKEIAEELTHHADDTKLSMRDRLRKQEEALNKKRDGGQ